MRLCFYLWSPLVLTWCWGIGFLSLCLRLSDGCWFEWHSCAFAGQPPKAPSDYYLLPLINVHFLWLCTHARARSGWIQPDPCCRKSINTIEVLILPPLWTICSFKSHLAEANLTFANEDLGSSCQSCLWFLIFKWIFSHVFFKLYKKDRWVKIHLWIDSKR